MTNRRLGRWTLALVAVLLYARTASFSTVQWDDQIYLTENQAVQTTGGILEIWSKISLPDMGTNWPLTNTTFWLEYQIWGARPGLFHLTNVVLHAVGVVLAFELCLCIGFDVMGSWIAAMFFAVHPIQVESVAWISERKNLLSAIFFFLSIMAFLRYRRGERPTEYLLAMTWFFCGLLSKTGVVVLPVVLLLADWLLIDGKPTWSSVMRLLPFFALSGLAGGVTAAVDRLETHIVPWPARLPIACQSVLFYVGKLAWPAELMPLYPRWDFDMLDWRDWLPTVWLMLCGLLLLWFRKRFDGRILWMLALTALTLFPTLGFRPFIFLRHTYVADHFMHLPCLGIFAIVGVSASRALRRNDVWSIATVFLLFAAVCGCAFKSVRQCEIWRDNQTFWACVFKTSSAVGYDAIARDRLQKRDWKSAIDPLQRVVALRPGDAYALSALGQCLVRTGNANEGMSFLKKAAAIDPSNMTAANRLSDPTGANYGFHFMRSDNFLMNSIFGPGVSWGILSLQKRPPSE